MPSRMPTLFLGAVSISALLCPTSAVSTATTPDEILNLVLQDIQALKEELADLKADNAQLQADNKDLRAYVGLPGDRERGAAAPHRDDQAPASPSQRKLTSSSSTRGSLLWSEGTFQFDSGSNFNGTVAAAGFQTKAPVAFIACASSDQQITSQGTAINFGSLQSDRGGAYDTASSTFTAPYDGLYLFSGSIMGKGDGDGNNWIRMAFSIKGASQEACAFTKGDYQPQTSTGVRTYPLCGVSFTGTLLTLL